MDAQGFLLNQKTAYDKLIHNEVPLQLGEKVQMEKVKNISLGPDRFVAGTHDNDPAINSIVYDAALPDGTIRECVENVIEENMLTQVDDD